MDLVLREKPKPTPPAARRGWQIRKDDTQGKQDGLEPLTWEFSADGKTATLYENIWRKEDSGKYKFGYPKPHDQHGYCE